MHLMELKNLAKTKNSFQKVNAFKSQEKEN